MESSSSKPYFLTSLLLFWAIFINVNLSTKAIAARPSSAASVGTIDTRFIRTSCGATTYPKLCFTSLATHASAIGSDPKLLAHTSLSVTLDTARSTSAMMVKLAQTHGLAPREVGAMRDCIEELRDSVDQLRRSLGEMNQLNNGRNFDLTMNDIQTWVSAALTDEDTCTDGFAGKSMNGNTKVAVRERIVNVAHMTSNSLALINSYASLHN
ncbi:hypothetical protein M9H77_10612 [Catharanthus roseus]|uniref:Uncharacterized protein n=1 Tax=Catharanthus roseus TaxID=4058 RepID=A0ACC0BC87_CATRO|nr:hypothetical protein M9H77_10612 [Catharanthus roseus]